MAEKIPSTQEHLDILDIQDGIILLKSNGAALVVQANAVNFDLLSEKEQDAMITAYATLLNSLSFHLQVAIRSRRVDISNYLAAVDRQAENQPNPYLKERIVNYKNFVTGLVQRGEILDKRFYLAIPYYTSLTPQAPSILSRFSQALGIKQKQEVINKRHLLQQARVELEPKKEHLIKQLKRLGIKARQLTTAELIELFYEIYNPEQSRLQHLREGGAAYTHTLVEPAVIPREREKIKEEGAPMTKEEKGSYQPLKGKVISPEKEDKQ
jgi:hypothetical protein